MAQAYTYDDGARRESLLDIITNITPTETQLYTGLARSSARNTLHEWPVDTLNAAADNATAEGASAGDGGQTNPSRAVNITQIVKKVFDVSDTERAVNSAGFKDRYAYEMGKAMKEWKNDAEFALMRGSIASGTGSAARRMQGIKNWITTNATAQSGVSLSETAMNSLFELAWSQGGKVDEVYVGSTLKRRISGFTANSTKNVDAEDKRLVNAVDVYESDFGIVKLFMHRHVTVSGDTNYDFVGIQSDKFRVAHLREPRHVPLAKDGDNTKGMIIGEFTLESLAESASVKSTAHL